MERRKAITTAAAASLTVLAGAAGIALNSGIVGTSDGNVGNISPVGTTYPPATVYVDQTGTTTPLVQAPAVRSTGSRPVATSAASGSGSDDDRYRHEDDHDDHDSDDRHQYEGAEDDD